jgi:hypothetical protein
MTHSIKTKGVTMSIAPVEFGLDEFVTLSYMSQADFDDIKTNFPEVSNIKRSADEETCVLHIYLKPEHKNKKQEIQNNIANRYSDKIILRSYWTPKQNH